MLYITGETDDGKEDLNFNFLSNSALFFLYNFPIKSNLTVIFEGLKITGMTNKNFKVAFFTFYTKKLMCLVWAYMYLIILYAEW